MAGTLTNTEYHEETTRLLRHDTEAGTMRQPQPDKLDSETYFRAFVLAFSVVLLLILVAFLAWDLSQGAVSVFKIAAIAFIMIAQVIMVRLQMSRGRG